MNDELRRLNQKLTDIRNELYDYLPTGDLSNWDALNLISNHLGKLDNFIDSELNIKP